MGDGQELWFLLCGQQNNFQEHSELICKHGLSQAQFSHKLK